MVCNGLFKITARLFRSFFLSFCARSWQNYNRNTERALMVAEINQGKRMGAYAHPESGCSSWRSQIFPKCSQHLPLLKLLKTRREGEKQQGVKWHRQKGIIYLCWYLPALLKEGKQAARAEESLFIDSLEWTSHACRFTTKLLLWNLLTFRDWSGQLAPAII